MIGLAVKKLRTHHAVSIIIQQGSSSRYYDNSLVLSFFLSISVSDVDNPGDGDDETDVVGDGDDGCW